MRNISSLQAKKTQLIANATAFVQRGLKTAAEKEHHRKLLAEVDIIQADLDSLSHIERNISGRTAPVAEEQRTITPPTPEEYSERRNSAYLNYLTRKPYEARDLTADATSGEALIAQDWAETWVAARKQFGPLSSLVRLIVKTNGTPTKVPLSDATSQTMTYLADAGSTSGIEADTVVSSVVPSTDTLVSFTKASLQLFRDAEVEGGLEGFVKNNLLGIAARYLETAILSGVDGSNTALPNNPGFLSTVTTGATTASASAITYSELLNGLYNSVDAAYRNAPGAAFYASQTTHDAIAGILDNQNRPIFHFDDSDGLLRVFGKKVYIAGTVSGMPSIGTASKPIVLFGDFSRALVATMRPLQTRVLTERFIADSMEYGFVSNMRIGSAAGISGAVKALVTAS